MNLYPFLYGLVRGVLALYHPVFKVKGRENLPAECQLIICGNHSGMADPIWLLFALKLNKSCPAIMAKASVMKIPLLGKILKHYGVFGVNRGENDISAVKNGLSALRNGKHLLLFPEATRVKKGKIVEPKNGAVMFSLRSGTPILPVWLEAKRYPFSPLRCVIGEPWMPQCAEAKPSQEEMSRLTRELMEKIYALEAKA
jgi:1-acyl-sn-glycerol-3-phosphate acyltransferase